MDPIHIPQKTRLCKCFIPKENDRFCVCKGTIWLPPPSVVPPLPPIPPTGNNHLQNKQRSLMLTGMTVVGSMLSSAILLAIFFAFVRFHFNRRNPTSGRRNPTSGRRNPPVFFGTRQDFLDEDRGSEPALDNPIWYINTVGLQQSVIDSITAFKYRKDEGIVDENQCSVCLNEFEEDESLRLLPKCSHAFHLPCIDTWLRSHKNCPLCRAPVVNEAVVEAPGSASMADYDSVGSNETQIVETSESNVGTSTNCPNDDGNMSSGNLKTNRGSVSGVSDDDDDADTQPVRRSVSLDLSSAMEIYTDVRIGAQKQVIKHPKGKIVDKRGSESSRLQLKKTGSIGASLSKGSVSMKRSFSCGGIFSLSKQTRSRNSILPL